MFTFSATRTQYSLFRARVCNRLWAGCLGGLPMGGMATPSRHPRGVLSGRQPPPPPAMGFSTGSPPQTMMAMPQHDNNARYDCRSRWYGVTHLHIEDIGRHLVISTRMIYKGNFRNLQFYLKADFLSHHRNLF